MVLQKMLPISQPQQSQISQPTVWAYTHKYCKSSSGIPTVTRDVTV